ncbi:MAG: pirin family protein [Puniceicoccales bacterium]|jgi:redox-sensitive bicupin YhaK (pirin superfamily)|nr:pirin family protein [Puniceicoccales bacterium]
MIKKLPHSKMGKSDLGWLQSIFHFSFADYYNPQNIHFGALRVINDDLIHPGKGFGSHPHDNMEIISYVVDGALTHKDSMGHERSLVRGEVQYMSAGTGVVHSEYNLGKEMCRILQIWILPDAKGHKPHYGDIQPEWKERENKWLHLVSKKGGAAPIVIHQDFNIHVATLDAGKTLSFEVGQGRQAYVVQIEGKAQVNDSIELDARDGLETVGESLRFKAQEDSHVMVLEMAS